MSDEQVDVVHSLQVYQQVFNILSECLGIDIVEKVEVQFVSSHCFEGLSVPATLEAFLDSVDHNNFGVDSFEIASG